VMLLLWSEGLTERAIIAFGWWLGFTQSTEVRSTSGSNPVNRTRPKISKTPYNSEL
jgi:hypothetical protein